MLCYDMIWYPVGPKNAFYHRVSEFAFISMFLWRLWQWPPTSCCSSQCTMQIHAVHVNRNVSISPPCSTHPTYGQGIYIYIWNDIENAATTSSVSGPIASIVWYVLSIYVYKWFQILGPKWQMSGLLCVKLSKVAHFEHCISYKHESLIKFEVSSHQFFMFLPHTHLRLCQTTLFLQHFGHGQPMEVEVPGKVRCSCLPPYGSEEMLSCL